jgi:hypothetical protein
MRDIETIDAELRLVSRARRVAREMSSCAPNRVHIDQLLDERAALGADSPDANSS